MRSKKTLRALLSGILFLALSLTVFFSVAARIHRENEVELRITLSISSLLPALCDALSDEEMLYLDGRFPLEVSACTLSPSLLRFYDGTRQCEFTVPSTRTKDATLTLIATARAHPFGYALGGVRTVNVGMSLTLYGKRCKIFGQVCAIEVLDS